MELNSLLLSWSPMKGKSKRKKKQLKTDSAFLAESNKRQREMKVNAEIKPHPVQSKFLQRLLQFRNIRILKSNNIGSTDNEKKESQSFSPHATEAAMLDWRILDIASRCDLHTVNPLCYAKSLCFLCGLERSWKLSYLHGEKQNLYLNTFVWHISIISFFLFYFIYQQPWLNALVALAFEQNIDGAEIAALCVL